NGLVLADYKFNILDRMPEKYFKNVARVKDAAAAAKIEIIPTVFPVGYSDGLLAHDPNLAEGLPVRDAPFVVKGREAVLASGAPPAGPRGRAGQPAADLLRGRVEADAGLAAGRRGVQQPRRDGGDRLRRPVGQPVRRDVAGRPGPGGGRPHERSAPRRLPVHG